MCNIAIGCVYKRVDDSDQKKFPLIELRMDSFEMSKRWYKQNLSLSLCHSVPHSRFVQEICVSATFRAESIHELFKWQMQIDLMSLRFEKPELSVK